MPPTILIVDDDEQILLLVEILLRRQGYQVLKAQNPYTALDILNDDDPRSLPARLHDAGHERH